MREHEMRMRVFSFLKARMRNMIMPATVGIGFAVGGCAKETSTPMDSAAVPIYSAVLPDGSTTAPDQAVPGPDQALADASRADMGVPVPVDTADAPQPDQRLADAKDSTVADASPKPDHAPAPDGAGIDAGKPDALVTIDTGTDLGGMKYIAPIPDAGIDTPATKYIAPIPDAAADKGGAATLYIAQIPDAGAADSLAVRYMAQIPDAGVAPLYMAPPPQQS